MQTLHPGTTLHYGAYRIKKVLGKGGFGITYLAEDVHLGRLVAIKEFFPKAFCDRDEATSQVSLGTKNTAQFVKKLKGKFLKEACKIANLEHPGIIRIYSAFEENNTAYYVMEYVEGGSLAEIVKAHGPLKEDKALMYIEKVAEALGYLHSLKINHLDVKPANIMIRKKDDSPILIDFGLSKQYDSEDRETSSMLAAFSHGFAPMEQYREGGVSEFFPQTDLYALGATLYYALSGVVPPQAIQLYDEDLTFPAQIPPRLIVPISKAMAPRRRDRHSKVEDFIHELNAGASTSPKKEITDSQTDTTIIRAKLSSSHSKSDVIGKKSQIKGHEFVDLGLPSGVKWATCNVGAFSPGEYGNYYAWGETSPKSTYKDINSLTRYKTKYELQSSGVIKTSGGLRGRHDAAQTNWGGSWRLPTKGELEELKAKCRWTWTVCEGKRGYKVVGPNGRSIFLPAAGSRYESKLDYSDSIGYYWTATLDDDAYRANLLYFTRFRKRIETGDRGFGCSIRPVAD